ncbi:hypothetical protein [Corynebacterium neomassiliense]|uniref:hypothetical protein n=1 Tax=Corynebacterium neomassiliense TaxID=2079482 RepID=UPI001031212A|nr:hypothetical protein [Corynebacterium neomassiliense]
MIRYLWRWLVLLVLCVTGYANSVGQLLATGSPTGIAYTVAAASMAVVMFLGVELRRRPDLPIHDREVDWIVGVMALILAVSLRTMLAPRLIEWSDLLRLDVLSLIVFTFGASALLFGSRSTLRFGAAWAVLVIYNGPVYALVTLLCGGGWAGSALATTLGVTVALVAVNDGSARRRTVVGGISFGVGALLCLIGQLLPGAGTRGADTVVAVLTCLPGLAGAVVASLTEIRVRHARPRIRRRLPSVPAARLAGLPVFVAAAVLAVAPLPRPPVTSVTEDAPGTTAVAVGVPLPYGWEQTGETSFGWASRYFGAGTTYLRQQLRATTVIPAWDREGRHREVMVDTLVPGDEDTSGRFGEEEFYSSVNGRRSPAYDIDLGHGVTGRVHTVLDEDAYLTTTFLRFSWRDDGPDGRVRHVSVLAVDDHRPGAAFPLVTDSLTGLAGRIVTVLLRGGAATQSTVTGAKDLDVVAAVGRGIIDARWKQSGPAEQAGQTGQAGQNGQGNQGEETA